MSARIQSGDSLRTFINAGLIVSLPVLAAGVYVRFVDPYPPLWTAAAIPAPMALFGLRLILQPRSARHDGRSQRAIGSLLILLSLVLLVLGLFEIDRANRSRAANFDPTSSNPDGDL